MKIEKLVYKPTYRKQNSAASRTRIKYIATFVVTFYYFERKKKNNIVKCKNKEIFRIFFFSFGIYL